VQRWHLAADAADAKAATVAAFRAAVPPQLQPLVSEAGQWELAWFVPAVAALMGRGVKGGKPSATATGRASAAAAEGVSTSGDGTAPPCPATVGPLALAAALAPEHLGAGVYRFPLFSAAFCEALCTAVDAYEATNLPRRRPNTMNNGGLVVSADLKKKRTPL
jgi:hypothetical protein